MRLMGWEPDFDWVLAGGGVEAVVAALEIWCRHFGLLQLPDVLLLRADVNFHHKRGLTYSCPAAKTNI